MSAHDGTMLGTAIVVGFFLLGIDRTGSFRIGELRRYSNLALLAPLAALAVAPVTLAVPWTVGVVGHK